MARRRKNASDRQILYTSAAVSAALGGVAYVTTHRTLPIIGAVLLGMLATPVLMGATPKQYKKLILTG